MNNLLIMATFSDGLVLCAAKFNINRMLAYFLWEPFDRLSCWSSLKVERGLVVLTDYGSLGLCSVWRHGLS